MVKLYGKELFLKLRRPSDFFWSLIFPIVLGTLFYASFGSGVDLEKMSAISAALVSEGNEVFEQFLESLEGDVLEVEAMPEEEALLALQKGKVQGVFYSSGKPSLTVASQGISESILASLLEGFTSHQAMLAEIGRERPAGLFAAAAGLSDYREMVEAVTVNGESTDNSVGYFYALISMACLFGAFAGMDSSKELRADQSALALRRSVAPVHRLKLVVSEMLAVFTLQFACVCLLLLYLHLLGVALGAHWPRLLPVCALGSMTGAAMGMFVGSLRLREGMKVAVLLFVSLTMSVLSGLMFVNMKDIVERHAPILNRVNPAALIADAFFCVSVYDDPGRYGRNLLILAGITAAFTAAGFFRLRRERYASL